MKMTEHEKLIALISYIKGSISGSKYVAPIVVEDFYSFLKAIGEK